MRSMEVLGGFLFFSGGGAGDGTQGQEHAK